MADSNKNASSASGIRKRENFVLSGMWTDDIQPVPNLITPDSVTRRAKIVNNVFLGLICIQNELE